MGVAMINRDKGAVSGVTWNDLLGIRLAESPNYEGARSHHYKHDKLGGESCPLWARDSLRSNEVRERLAVSPPRPEIEDNHEPCANANK